MSDPQTSRSELPIIPALVVSSLLGGLIALGLFSLWRFAMPGAANPPNRSAAAPAVALSSSGSAEFVEFLPPLTPQEQRIEEALEKPAECDLQDQPLADVVAFLAEHNSIRMVIDVEALTEEGIATDTPVTQKLSGLKLRSLLNLVLRPLQLTAIPKDDVLLVTTLTKQLNHPLNRTYPVSDLCRVTGSNALDFQSLIMLLEATSAPWLSTGGEGGAYAVLTNTGSFTVRHTYAIHREVLELLRSLRAAQKSNLLNASKSDLQKWDEQRAAAASALLKRSTVPIEFVDVLHTPKSESEPHIESSLDKSLSISFQDAPLTEVVASFARQLSINVVLDNESLTEEGIATDTPVTLQLQQITGRSALELLLRPLQLSAVIDNEVLLVTTAHKEKETLVSHTYPVSDLIGPNEDFQSLMTMLETSTSGPWLNTHGEGGTMTELPTAGSLVVRQTSAVQRQVLNLLHQQREAQKRMQPHRIIDKSNRRSEKPTQPPQSGGGYFRTSMSSEAFPGNGMELSRWR